METKGKWEIGKFAPHSNHIIYVQRGRSLWERDRIADCYDSEANAELIVTAVNACKEFDNPLAVANEIKEMYEALHEITTIEQNDVPYDKYDVLGAINIAKKVLSNIKGVK